MKKVQIKSLKLINFKGVKYLEINFNSDVNSIMGDNATGKSTIFDAFTWLLFGKDSSGRTDSNFSIKTVDKNGKVIPQIDHEVTGILFVNDQEIELRRVYREDWVKPKGEAVSIMKGHETLFYFNGVPQKAGEYKSAIDSIIEETLFKLITSPLFFASLDWKQQREILLRIAGGVTLEEISQNKVDFQNIISQLAGRDLAKFKAEISARKSKIKTDLDQIPTRIDEAQRNTPQAPDYSSLESTLSGLRKELSDVDLSLLDRSEAIRIQYEEVQKKQQRVNDLKNKQQNLIYTAQQQQQSDLRKRNDAYDNALREYESIQQNISITSKTTKAKTETINGTIQSFEQQIAQTEVEIARKRAEWTEANSQEFKEEGEFICPVYQKACSDSVVMGVVSQNRGMLRSNFYEKKEETLNSITDVAENLKANVDNLKEKIKELRSEIENIQKIADSHIQKMNLEADRHQDIMFKNPRLSTIIEVKGENIPEYVDLSAQITELSQTIGDIPKQDNSDLTDRKIALTEKIDSVRKQLSVREIIEQTEKRIDQLRREEKELAQQLADLERQEFTIQELTKARMNEVETRVNKLFNLVSFKMFDTQINGGEKEDCIAMIGGVKFNDLNTASKINAGLDIINTLCNFHQISAPVFIDNAEAVNRLFPLQSQLIRLVVTTHKELSFAQ